MENNNSTGAKPMHNTSTGQFSAPQTPSVSTPKTPSNGGNSLHNPTTGQFSAPNSNHIDKVKKMGFGSGQNAKSFMDRFRAKNKVKAAPIGTANPNEPRKIKNSNEVVSVGSSKDKEYKQFNKEFKNSKKLASQYAKQGNYGGIVDHAIGNLKKYSTQLGSKGEPNHEWAEDVKYELGGYGLNEQQVNSAMEEFNKRYPNKTKVPGFSQGDIEHYESQDVNSPNYKAKNPVATEQLGQMNDQQKLNEAISRQQKSNPNAKPADLGGDDLFATLRGMGVSPDEANRLVDLHSKNHESEIQQRIKEEMGFGPEQAGKYANNIK